MLEAQFFKYNYKYMKINVINKIKKIKEIVQRANIIEIQDLSVK